MHDSIFNVATVTMATSSTTTTNNVQSIAQRYEKERTTTTNITDLSLSLNFPSFWLFNVIMSVCAYGMGMYVFLEIVFDFTTYLCWCICTGKLCTHRLCNRLSTLKSSQHTIQFTHLCLFFRAPKFLAFDTRYYYYDHEMLMIIIYLFILTIPISWITVVLPFRFLYTHHWTREYRRRIVSLFCYCCSKYKVKSLTRKTEWMELPNRFALTTK